MLLRASRCTYPASPLTPCMLPCLPTLPRQVANEPGLAPALSELIDNSTGQEIYLRRPERYSLHPEQPTTFANVVELAKLRGETALG